MPQTHGRRHAVSPDPQAKCQLGGGPGGGALQSDDVQLRPWDRALQWQRCPYKKSWGQSPLSLLSTQPCHGGPDQTQGCGPLRTHTASPVGEVNRWHFVTDPKRTEMDGFKIWSRDAAVTTWCDLGQVLYPSGSRSPSTNVKTAKAVSNSDPQRKRHLLWEGPVGVTGFRS